MYTQADITRTETTESDALLWFLDQSAAYTELFVQPCVNTEERREVPSSEGRVKQQDEVF